VKYAFVEKNRRQYGVSALCDALQVSRSGYYAARHRGPSDRQQRRVNLTARIRTIHQASRESYGAPRVHVELMAQEVPCCRNTVAKLMHKAGIVPQGDPAVPCDHRLPQDQGIAEPHQPLLNLERIALYEWIEDGRREQIGACWCPRRSASERARSVFIVCFS